MTGHAGAGQYGHDIVCAAVSSLSIATVNGIIAVAKVKPRIKKDSVAGGLLVAKVPNITDAKQNLKTQTLLQSFKLGIKSIVKNYSQYVSFKIVKK